MFLGVDEFEHYIETQKQYIMLISGLLGPVVQSTAAAVEVPQMARKLKGRNSGPVDASTRFFPERCQVLSMTSASTNTFANTLYESGSVIMSSSGHDMSMYVYGFCRQLTHRSYHRAAG